MSNSSPSRFEDLSRSIDGLRTMDSTNHAHPGSSGRSYEASRHASKAPFLPPMNIVLSGLPVDGRTNAFDFIIPHARRSTLLAGPVQHLDVISCWKGVTNAQAWELASWDYFFKECLAVQIKEYLQREFLSRLRGSTTQPLMMDRMMQFFKNTQPLMINVDMLRLVDDMIRQMYTTYPSVTAQRRFPWTLSSGDLPSFVYNFVHTQDCFTYSIDGPRVWVDLSSRHSQGDLIVYVELHWQYEKTTFLGLRHRLSCDQSYRITPYTAVAGDTTRERYNFSQAQSDVTYSVSKSSLPLQWDDQQDCFHSVVLRDAQGPNGLVVTELSTKISTLFHRGTRFERISRYVLHLEVKSDSSSLQVDLKLWDEAVIGLSHEHSSPWVPSYTNTPLSKTCFRTPGQANIAQTHCAILQDPCLSRFSSQYWPSTSSIIDGTPSRGESSLIGIANSPSSTRSPIQDQYQSQRPHTSHVDHVGHSRSYPSPERLSSSTSLSPGKRKAWQPDARTTEFSGPFALDKVQHPDLSVDTKRRKIAQHDDPDILMNESTDDSWLDDLSEDILFDHLAHISTGLMGNAHSSTSTWYKKLQQDEAYSPPKASAAPSPPKPHIVSLGCNKHTNFVWPNPYYSQRSSAVRVDEVMDSSNDEISPTATSSTASLPPLFSQEQIQRNYQEFEQRQSKKAAEKAYYTATIPGFDGVVSPTDAEGKTFESIFLGNDKDNNGEDWVSATDAVSEGLSAISLED
ncbi:hypothetical protein DE146DRAFT_1283 [Phaeosphaeria sp. MPI-PUGE-AT-0046c]|nr:hypothetical protein DE146DRAFT_1283 [Phaeosphaeria sp. MPI-PUGE-AT-0046c]